jgi:RNA polymerase sigma-B factor
VGRSEESLKERGSLSFGVAREGFVVSVVATLSALLVDPRYEDLPRAERTRLLLEAVPDCDSPAEREALEERVIRDNMSIAAAIAARYRQRGVPLEDLEQVAYMALVKAVRRYEYAADRDFLSYAVPTIRGELRRYFRDHGWTIRPGRSVQEAQRRITAAEGDLAQTLGRSPRPSEIAQHLDLDLDLVTEALAANGCFQPTSLDAAKTDEDQPIADRLGEHEAGFHAIEAQAVLRPILEQLTEREKVMLEMRFFQNATQSQIGAALGITQMQVSRLLSNLMARLRDQLMTEP